MDRSSKLLIRKIIIDFLCIVLVGISALSLFFFGKPYQRGFFCDDESIRHPFESSTITSPMLYMIGLFLPICVMLIGEYNHKRSAGSSSYILFGHDIPHWFCSAYTKIGIFIFGAISTVLTTDIAKYTIGRLRPHFWKICDPDINCSLPENQHKYIENFKCKNVDSSPRALKEARLSFPSGHSSFSAYTMVYLALYLQLRITWKGSHLLRHLLQFICVWMAWFTAMSRVSNYKHHWSDVLVGLLLGITIASIMVFCIGDLFKERKNRLPAEKNLRSIDYEAGAMGTQSESCPLNCTVKSYGGLTNNPEEPQSILE